MLSDHFSRIERSVFVISYGRSGSTLLQNMLNAVPGYLVRGENANMLAHLVRVWHDLRFSEQAANMRWASTARWGGRTSTPIRPWFGYDTIDFDQLGRGLAEVFLRDVLRPEADTRVIGFKEIRWHHESDLFGPMLDFLRRYMPGKVQFIFNTRDHEEVCQSGWWKAEPRAEVLEELEQAEALYSAWQARNPHDYFTVHYNTYAFEPKAWRPLFDYLQEPFDIDLVHRILDEKLTHLK